MLRSVEFETLWLASTGHNGEVTKPASYDLLESMIERITEYPGYLIRFKPDVPTEKAIIFFHGFPAHRGTKGLDIADYLHRRLNQAVYILHFRGLGESKGTFKFTESIQESMDVVKLIVNHHGYDLNCVIGHSWGGLVAVNLAHQEPKIVNRLILMSPLCNAKDTDPTYPWMLNEVQKEWPGVYGDMTKSEVEADIKKIADAHLPLNLAPSIAATVQITLIQALQDPTTPPSRAKAFCEKLVNPPKYIELDLDHSFSQDRRLLLETIYEDLKN